jgi:hypothetical protein
LIAVYPFRRGGHFARLRHIRGTIVSPLLGDPRRLAWIIYDVFEASATFVMKTDLRSQQWR